MPAITLGLAEVEERLRVLRRRLNSVTAQHSIYLGASSVTLLVTAVIVVALRASASAFRITACASALLMMVIAAACLAYVRRRWLDVQCTARLVDARAQLLDRLSTLIDLRLRPRPSRLAPILVAQALALGAHWQARQIAPRRIPRSILLFIASLLALAGTALLAHRTLPAVPSPTTATAEKLAELSLTATSGAQRNSGVRAAEQPGTAGALQPPTVLLPPGDFPGRAQGSEPGRGQSSNPGPSSEATTRTSFADRLQQTIRHAFHGDAPEQPSQLASRSGNSSHPDSTTSADRNPTRNRSDQPEGTAPKETDSSGRQKDPAQSNSGRRAAQPQGGSNAPQNFQGSSPAAGTGSSPQGVMDPNAPAAVAVRGESKRFKLAITSFLYPVPQQAGRPAPAGGRAGAAGPGGSDVALNDRQLTDDAVRKAEIPPEYEDLVRRVYSRPEQ